MEELSQACQAIMQVFEETDRPLTIDEILKGLPRPLLNQPLESGPRRCRVRYSWEDGLDEAQINGPADHRRGPGARGGIEDLRGVPQV